MVLAAAPGSSSPKTARSRRVRGERLRIREELELADPNQVLPIHPLEIGFEPPPLNQALDPADREQREQQTDEHAQAGPDGGVSQHSILPASGITIQPEENAARHPRH